MSGEEAKKKPTPEPAKLPDGHTTALRSGSGAGTALVAMLKRRQMRASRDVEPDPPATVKPPRKTAKD
jgi:hypothetical protein